MVVYKRLNWWKVMKPSPQKMIELQRFNCENFHWCVGWLVSYGKVVADKRWSHKEVRLYLRLPYYTRQVRLAN